MNPARRNIPIWRGNTETLTFRLKNADGLPSDLTGNSIKMVIDNDGTLTNVAATIATPQSDGKFTIFLSADVTKILTAKNYVPNYEIQRTSGAETKTVLYGNLHITGSTNHD